MQQQLKLNKMRPKDERRFTKKKLLSGVWNIKLYVLLLVVVVIGFAINVGLVKADTINDHSTTLNGSSQYYGITDASQTGLDLGADFTLETWIKIGSQPATDQSEVIINKDDNASNRQYALYYKDTSGTKILRGLVFENGSSSYVFSDVAQTLTNGTWYHIAMTFDGSEAKETQFEFFVDGTSVGNGTATEAGGGASSVYNGTSPFRIGATGAGTPANYIEASFDDVRVWNDIRTENEIDTNKENCELSVAETGLVSWWGFDTEDGTDYNSNGNDLTMYNTPTFQSASLPYTCSTTPETSTTTLYALSCTPEYTNDISHINACSYTSSTTNATYTNYHIPFFLYMALAIPFLWIANRFVMEIIIRLREKI